MRVYFLGRRRDWHERAARALEERFPELAANEPELLAHHFGEAGLARPACDYRMKAGDRALRRSAYPEAVAHYSAGLKWADGLPEPAERMRRQLDFLLKLGPALMIARGLERADVEDAYRRAAEIGKTIEDVSAVFKAKWGLWFNARRTTALARDRARELVMLAHRSSDGDLLLEAYHCRWSTALFQGEVAGVLGDTRLGLDSYDTTRHRHLGPTFGDHDPGTCAHVARAIALQMSGDQDQAKDILSKGIALAEALDHPNSLAQALQMGAISRQFAGDRENTYALAHRVAALAEKYGLSRWSLGSLLLMAWAGAVGSGVADAARLIDAEIDKATAAVPETPYLLGLAGEVLLAAARPGDGLAHLDRAIAAVEEPDVGLYLPEVYRLRGECLLAIDHANKDDARRVFSTARDIARRRGAVIFEHRAEASLLKITGKPDAA